MTMLSGNDSGPIGRGWRAVLAVFLIVPILYCIAATIGSAIPRNSGWNEPAHGTLIFVRNNGVHVDLILPATAAGINLYRPFPPSHIRDPSEARGWVAFGWGQRELYLETPRWSDLSIPNAARVTFGGNALMHVEHLATPQVSRDIRPIVLDQEAYRRLVDTVIDGFATNGRGRPVPLLGRGYGGSDVFYEATGHYNALRTCNQWAADALALAGVRVGVWTPFAPGIMWRFR